jgi:hypothetical protein
MIITSAFLGPYDPLLLAFIPEFLPKLSALCNGVPGTRQKGSSRARGTDGPFAAPREM